MTALTTTERQQNRRRLLNQAAQALGYDTWAKYETAIIKDREDKMSDRYYPQIMTLRSENFASQTEYRKAYRDCCQHYDFKNRVDGGWIFFEFVTDQDTWKRQR